MIIPFAMGKVYIATFISILILAANIISTALIINHYPGTEVGLLG